MKYLSWILHAISLVAIAYLLISRTETESTSSSSLLNKKNAGSSEVLQDSITGSLVYIKLETLLTQYEYALDLNDNMMKILDGMKAELQRESDAFESDYRKFESKVKSGTFLSQASMENQQGELVQRQQQLQKRQYDLENELLEEQQRVESLLYLEIVAYLEEIRAQESYQFIVSLVPGSDILVGDPALDITSVVLTELNKRYLDQKE